MPVLAGFVLWFMADRPAILISDDGSLIGRIGAEGRVLNKAKGAGFVASVWLENDGDFANQITAAARDMPVLDLPGLSIAHVSGRGWQEATRRACVDHDFVVNNQIWQEAVPEGCLLVDVGFLRQSGALALSPRGETVEMRTAYATSGVRLWNTPALRGPRGGEAREVRDALPPMVLGARFAPDTVRLANRQ